MNKEIYKTFLRNFNGLVLITDLKGKIIDFSKKVLSVLNIKMGDDFTGKSILEFLGPISRKEYKRFLEGIQHLDLNQTYQFNFITNDGSLLIGKIQFSPIRMESDQLKYLILTIEDITKEQEKKQKRDRIERELRKSQKMLQLVINNIPQFIFWKDINGKFLGCNDNFAEAAGFDSPSEIVGKTDFDLAWKKSEAESFFETDRLVIETGIPHYNIIESQSQADGRKAWLDINKIPLRDADGVVVGLLGTYEDITERVNNQNRLKASEQRYKSAYNRAEFYKDVFTHDISNILQSILSSIEISKLYLKKENKNRNLKNILELMVNQINRGAILVENIKKLSLIDEDDSIEKLRLDDMLFESINFLKKKYEDQTIDIKIENDYQDVYIFGNHFILDALKNLLRNSVIHNENKQIKIIIRLDKIKENSKNYVKLSIIDNGKGIPDPQKKAIINENIETNISLKRIGLGLALVKKILNCLDGEIRISNKIYGDSSKGSKISILIPEA
ncbi:MAG: putative Histidine kinase [Promethearchaeota archaeon]|nr:MAG: putative Histidine kinase [Candidatus Lokiarchaeota archaeon]